ncbi:MULTISPECIES: NADP-dependent oxidoreductase [Brachybacterium]|uniref:Zn-dependent oxidoreductase n=1 Tax=Brachybacterium alimentarium TaxID=47845 RepID=A0A2A3YLZ2_9MICO|nr:MULTISPECIES: NADP-dependent oxidoreductase [Brachybacterium]PCC34745.1 Zn-dependent oxidoreductase [Brachybacterium alimentarium]PCC40125.1 Zn-dependent oxidoreductase [Brachybacterium alimentarium]RCS63607.1 NADP-dependent oxidoreductase [Brachybacterium sp. JB7]RCS69399.1 NADP-dependent oxidoreductase [Brachybacterium alimentarium]RCS71389.1 NADP-dependent oxidoreductase [Brachybacterium alimentarium]
MREIRFDRFGGPEVLSLIPDAPMPEPGPDEVLVEVAFVGLNPLDYKIRDGSSGMSRDLQLPAGTGREMAGTVIGAGAGLDEAELGSRGLSVGTRVFGMRAPGDPRGVAAEVIAIGADDLAPIPGEISDEDLPRWAGLALAGLTAIAVIDDSAAIAPGQTVLVHGGSGGVGQLLIPMAIEAGASQVWATGRADNAERIRELGAVPIPYDTGNWQEEIHRLTDGRGVDVVLDTHYHSTFVPSLDHVTEGGLVVTLPTLADLTPAHERGVEATVPRIKPGRDRLDRLVQGIRAGRYLLEVSQVLPLDEIARAHSLLEDGHTRGKLVLAAQS